jgi:hypothetical protein
MVSVQLEIVKFAGAFAASVLAELIAGRTIEMVTLGTRIGETLPLYDQCRRWYNAALHRTAIQLESAVAAYSLQESEERLCP